MAKRKFQIGDRVKGHDIGPASYCNRVGTVVDFKGPGGYGVKFDDTGVTEYLNSDLLEAISERLGTATCP